MTKMDTQKAQQEKEPAPAAAMTSCRKKKNDDASFLEDLRDHIDEFIHASMDEHKACFKNTVQKMFAGMSKISERNADAKGVESALPLQTTVSD